MAESPNDEEVLGKGRDWRMALRLLQYLRPYKWHSLFALALTLLSAPLLMAGPPLTKAAVDMYLLTDSSTPLSGFDRLLAHCASVAGFGGSKHQGIVFITLVFLTSSIAAFLLRYAQIAVAGIIGQKAMYSLREDIFKRTQELPIEYYDRTPVGRLMTRLTADVEALSEMFASGVVSVLGNVILVFYIVSLMLWVNWRLALVSFAVLPLLALLTTILRRWAIPAFREVRVRLAGINAFLQEALTGIQIVQMFSREQREVARFTRVNDAHRKANVAAAFYNAAFDPLVSVIQAIGLGLIIWYGGRETIRGVATIGTMIAFIQLAQAFYEPISEISERYNVLQVALASSERIFELLDQPVTTVSLEQPREIARVRGRIEFRDVWFAYVDEDWVLKGVSFVAEPGERIAFVGHTGAGKTTITNLLLRFYEIQRGQILLDSIDIRELDIQELRSSFSVVLQDAFLFSGDIASNIKLGNEAITDAVMKSAALDVHADEFIMKLRNGYQSQISERGAGLSVGQKQLIGFARALAFGRSVLILDEATSSIDTETEMLIHDAIERLMAGRTSLVIAHRLSTIQSVDKILVMQKGEVREIGDHQSLLAGRGIYWRLYQLQFDSRVRRKATNATADH